MKMIGIGDRRENKAFIYHNLPLYWPVLWNGKELLNSSFLSADLSSFVNNDIKADESIMNDVAIFWGYAAVFAVVDRHKDVITKGAFRYDATGGKMRLFWEHAGSAVGIVDSVIEDDYGLYVQGRLDMSTEAGHKIYKTCQAGEALGLSVAGFVSDADCLEGDEVQMIKSFQLEEVSVVRIPANPYTAFACFKLDDASASLEVKAGLDTG